MIPQNRVGIGGLFFISLLQNPPNCPQKVHTKYKLLKKIVKGRFPGSGIQMVGKPKILADNPKCRAWLSLDNFYFKHNFKSSNLPKLSCILITMITVK